VARMLQFLIFDFEFCPAVAGHAYAWMLDGERIKRGHD
jgi:hypothetical protein